MPVEVRGAYELNKALGQLAPDLKKNLNREVRAFLAPITKEAKAYAPATISGLSNWTFEQKGRKITAQSSMFRRGKFPRYNASDVKAGIKTRIGASKVNNQGFVSLYRIENTTAAGAIYETAGRKNPLGQPWKPRSSSKKYSHSFNPYAGRHFIGSINATNSMEGDGKMRGRLIYKAWYNNQGRALGKVVKAVEETQKTFHARLDAQKAFEKIKAA